MHHRVNVKARDFQVRSRSILERSLEVAHLCTSKLGIHLPSQSGNIDGAVAPRFRKEARKSGDGGAARVRLTHHPPPLLTREKVRAGKVEAASARRSLGQVIGHVDRVQRAIGHQALCRGHHLVRRQRRHLGCESRA
eukprot:scaffold5375_cov110-Isochrysis_galbana.AAC.5